MRNATDQLNQEIEYLDTIIEYLIKAEVIGMNTEELFELRETTVRGTTIEKTKENLKSYLSNLEASYIKR